MTSYNWGIVGTGWIAHDMGEVLAKRDGEIYGVCGSSLVKAKEFAKEYPVKMVYSDLDDMLADPHIDIVYIATPHNLHYAMIKAALLKGKHVFCEKAITVNSQQLEECVNIANEKQLVLSDGVTLFHMPLYKKLRQVVQSGKLGKVKMIQVNFGSLKEYDVNSRFFSKELAGGALLDIGVYAVSFVRYFMTSQPEVILTSVEYFETGVDESSGIILKNQEGEMGVIALTMRAKQPKRGVIACEHGYIEINEYPRADEAKITYTNTGETEVIKLGDSKEALHYEVLDMENYISTKTGAENLQMIQDVMAILTKVRQEWGMVYPFE